MNAGGGAKYGLVQTEAAAADGVDISLECVPGVSGTAFLMYRASGFVGAQWYWVYEQGGTAWSLNYWNGSGNSVIDTGTGSFSSPFTVKVTLSGDDHTLYVNDSEITSITDSANNTARYVGFGTLTATVGSWNSISVITTPGDFDASPSPPGPMGVTTILQSMGVR